MISTKGKVMVMMGAAAGIGAYIGLSKLSKNKNKIKSKLNNIVDNTIDSIN